MLRILTALLTLSFATPPLQAAGVATEECCEPGSPFMLGEEFPETPATCRNIEHWTSRAPDIQARVSMTISGQLTGVHWDGVLAYLLMCEETGMQVVCVTYSIEGREVGETVLLAGGYSGANEQLTVLDPCLASPAESAAED